VKLHPRHNATTAAILLSALIATGAAQRPIPHELLPAHQALEDKHYQQAEKLFADYLKTHPGNIDAEEGIGDARLGLHEYEAAELQYRAVVAAEPEFWLAHKNLVIVEAALGRWDEFDRERAVLRGARQRGAPNISTRESDVIDAFDVHGEHWIVREYYEPVGRSLTRYNFEYFGPDGRVRAAPPTVPVIKDFALNFYTGKSHGTIKLYPKGEPSYEHVRTDLRHWLLTKPVHP
jgi:tetratricopeptide (TPR) repeat protein